MCILHLSILKRIKIGLSAILMHLKAVGTLIPLLPQKTPQLINVLSSTVETEVPTVSSHVPTDCLSIPPDLFGDTTASVSLNEVEADLSNMETNIQVSPTLTLRIHKVHPKSQINGPIDTPVQTRQKTKNMEEQSFIATIHQKTNPELLQYCLFSCFLSQEEPKKIFDALKDPSWVEAITKWVLKNKRDKRGIVIRNKARLVAQGYTQEEGIDYEEVFTPVARIEAIRLFLAYASYIGFTVYQMDVKSVFLYGTIDEEVYVMQPPRFQDSQFPDRVYKYLLDNGFQRGLQLLQKKDGIFLSQDKYVFDILKKFGLSDVRSANTPMDREHPWGKDRTGKDVELHLYRSMIGSLMYLTASRLDIMYLKGHPKFGLWYPKESSFDLVAYSDSDYGGATQDRKSTTGGCQFLGRRLISWQCKKQTIMATSTTEAEYVAAASGCGQVLWIQNQLLDYGYNFMNTKIYIDNNSAICIVKNPVYHSRTKHIEIRHHFIRDCYEKKLINVDHIHSDDNVADLLTKAFDVGRF
ncbi:putative ribonuclease H-like domain-containing protein [Tanacetum coccineum]